MSEGEIQPPSTFLYTEMLIRISITWYIVLIIFPGGIKSFSICVDFHNV